MRFVVFFLVVLFSSFASSSAMYEATTAHLDDERPDHDFNLLDHLDWEAHAKAQPSDEELEAAGIRREDLDFMRPYIPGERIKQLYPIMKELDRQKQLR